MSVIEILLHRFQLAGVPNLVPEPALRALTAFADRRQAAYKHAGEANALLRPMAFDPDARHVHALTAARLPMPYTCYLQGPALMARAEVFGYEGYYTDLTTSLQGYQVPTARVSQLDKTQMHQWLMGKQDPLANITFCQEAGYKVSTHVLAHTDGVLDLASLPEGLTAQAFSEAMLAHTREHLVYALDDSYRQHQIKQGEAPTGIMWEVLMDHAQEALIRAGIHDAMDFPAMIFDSKSLPLMSLVKDARGQVVGFALYAFVGNFPYPLASFCNNYHGNELHLQGLFLTQPFHRVRPDEPRTYQQRDVLIGAGINLAHKIHADFLLHRLRPMDADRWQFEMADQLGYITV